MATDELKRRIREMAEQLRSELGDFSVPEGECWLTVIEDMAAELGDTLATTLVEVQSARRPDAAEACCPKCGGSGHYRGARERELITRRGPATISEPEYYCDGCRKSFFPDDDPNRWARNV
jgi:hypothetical protein